MTTINSMCTHKHSATKKFSLMVASVAFIGLNRIDFLFQNNPNNLDPSYEENSMQAHNDESTMK